MNVYFSNDTLALGNLVADCIKPAPKGMALIKWYWQRLIRFYNQKLGQKNILSVDGLLTSFYIDEQGHLMASMTDSTASRSYLMNVTKALLYRSHKDRREFAEEARLLLEKVILSEHNTREDLESGIRAASRVITKSLLVGD